MQTEAGRNPHQQKLLPALHTFSKKLLVIKHKTDYQTCNETCVRSKEITTCFTTTSNELYQSSYLTFQPPPFFLLLFLFGYSPPPPPSPPWHRCIHVSPSEYEHEWAEWESNLPWSWSLHRPHTERHSLQWLNWSHTYRPKKMFSAVWLQRQEHKTLEFHNKAFKIKCKQKQKKLHWSHNYYC